MLFCISCYTTPENHDQAPGSDMEVVISIDPSRVNQKLDFGGDTKLSVKQWAEGQTDLISKKLYEDINLDILRIPIFTRININDSIYDQVAKVVKSVQKNKPTVRIFASVANGDGYEENNLHREEKFPDDWIGCCPENVYNMDLEKYVSYLDSFMVRMRSMDVAIHYLGTFNEDRAFAVDYNSIYNNMQELGESKKVDLERYNLSTSVKDVSKIGDQTDILGSHYFDDKDQTQGPILWDELVKTAIHPVWFTESTRFKIPDSNENLMNGLNHIFPAINAGVEAVIFYQVFPRFITPDGIALPSKYSGFRTFINSFNAAHVIESSSSDVEVKCVANINGDKVTIHLLNYHSTMKAAHLIVKNKKVAEARILTWTDQSIGNETSMNIDHLESLEINLPANSYLSIELLSK